MPDRLATLPNTTFLNQKIVYSLFSNAKNRQVVAEQPKSDKSEMAADYSQNFNLKISNCETITKLR